MRRRSTAGKGLALALIAAVLAAAPARLVLDASVPEDRAHVESSHDPARCGYLHDHAACQLLFASAATPATQAAAEHPLPPLAEGVTAPATPPSGRAAASATLPRAPPHLGS